mmetsp:Transcript_64495/g.122284  ORF Transcript_64495/g.122284 Transcript_64495/m.122284 type:complete len:234 (-) Transcript_64495:34-735(-)
MKSVVLAEGPLGRHVSGSAHEGHGHAHGGIQVLGDPEVSQLHLSRVVDQDVCWLNISVEQFPGLQVMQAPDNLCRNTCQMFGGYTVTFQTPSQVYQAASIHQLDDYVNETSLPINEAGIPLDKVRTTLRLDETLDLRQHLLSLFLVVHLDGFDRNAHACGQVHARLDNATCTRSKSVITVHFNVSGRQLVLVAADLDASVRGHLHARGLVPQGPRVIHRPGHGHPLLFIEVIG